MAIDNIPRTGTIDEWRIQTNQSAGELNKLETGDYTKTAGTFAANGTSRIFVGGPGTALEVVNTASFQNNIVVSKTISLGDFNSSTGNLSVGHITTIYGNTILNGIGEGLYVANTSNIRGNLIVAHDTRTDNINVYSTGTFDGDVILTDSGNTFFINTGSSNIQTQYSTENYTTNSFTKILRVSANAEVLTHLDVGANVHIGQYLDVTQNAAIGSYLDVTQNAAIGSYLDVTQNAAIGTTLVVTGNTTVGNLNTGGVANSQTLRVIGAGTIGSYLDVTQNAAIGTTLVVTGNTTVGNLTTSNVVSANIVRVSSGGLTVSGPTELSNISTTGYLEVGGDFQVSGNLVYDTDTLIISASTPKDSGVATFGVYRTGSNAEIRWSASDKQWQLRDVDNPTSYSKILTANLISNSIISISESNIASSNTANILNNKIDALTTTNIPEGNSLYLTAARVRNNVSVSEGNAGYNSTTGVITIPSTTSHVTEGSNLYYTDTRVRAAISYTTGSAGYNSTSGVITIPSTTSHVTEGSNLYLTAARVRANISYTTGSAGYNSTTGVITIPSTTSHVSEGSNLYYTDTRVRAAVSFTAGSGAYNSLTGVFTIPTTTSHVTEGSNLYYTDARARAAISASGSLSYNSTTGVVSYTTPSTSGITEGSNLYYTDARARSAISASGSLSYNSTTGVVSYTTPSTSGITEGSNLYFTNARARSAVSFTAGSGAYNSTTGVFTIPTNTNQLTNGAGFVTSSGVTSVATGNGLSGGTITSTGTLTMSGSYTGTFAVTGSITATSDVTAYYSSDIRLKENVVEIQNALDKVNSIRGVTYDWTDEYIKSKGGEDGYLVRKHDVGVIAQEIENVLPEIVGERDDGIKAVKYERLTALLIQAVKELNQKVNELQEKYK